jgi:peptidoglycan/LPS O-acetylase OafA/YrhL
VVLAVALVIAAPACDSSSSHIVLALTLTVATLSNWIIERPINRSARRAMR